MIEGALSFESPVDLPSAFRLVPGYAVEGQSQGGSRITFDGTAVASSFIEEEFYQFLAADWSEKLSDKPPANDALLVHASNKLFFVEVRVHARSDAVEEDLQGCGFKKRQLLKLDSCKCREIECVYILDDRFKRRCFEDTLDHVRATGCHYFFDELPLNWLGLPAGDG